MSFLVEFLVFPQQLMDLVILLHCWSFLVWLKPILGHKNVWRFLRLNHLCYFWLQLIELVVALHRWSFLAMESLYCL